MAAMISLMKLMMEKGHYDWTAVVIIGFSAVHLNSVMVVILVAVE